MKKRRAWITAAVLLLLLPANRPAGERLDFASLERVSDDELAEQRGGFSWGGLTIRFGAEIRTWLGDELVLHTTVNWTEEGAVTSQTASGVLTPVDAAALQNGILSSGNITIKVGDAKVFLANEGGTAILHQTDGSIRNVLINTATGVTARQQIDATLDLGGYDGFRDDLMRMHSAGQLGDMVSQSTAGHLGN